jgi:hypothetical protein
MLQSQKAPYASAAVVQAVITEPYKHSVRKRVDDVDLLYLVTLLVVVVVVVVVLVDTHGVDPVRASYIR